MVQYLQKLSNYVTKIKLSFLIIIFISSLITFLLWQNFKDVFLPFSLNITERVDGNPSTITIYEDLNSDGYSESLGYGLIEGENISVVLVRNYSGAVEDQFNFNGEIIENGILFGDLNSDNDKEIIVFYQNDDSLYFDVINTASRTYQIKKQLFITKPDSASGNNWDLMVVNGSKVVDLNSDGSDELIIGLRAGYAIYPRTLYTYNFQKNEIINKLELSAPVDNIILKDINADGKFEIFINTIVSGNINSEIKFNDQSAWIFLLDHNLNFIIQPRSFGKYPKSQLLAEEYIDNKFILVEIGVQDKTNSMYILNNITEIESVKKINYEIINDLLPLVNRKIPILYLSTNDGDIIQLNENFETLKVISTGLMELKFISADDFGMSNENKLLVGNNNEIRLYSEDLDLLGKLSLNPNIYLWSSYITNRNSGSENKNQLGIGNNKSFLLITIEQNKNRVYLYPILFIIFLLIVATLYTLKIILLQFYFYFKSFLHLFYKSETGYCIVDKNLRVKYLNLNFRNYLKLPELETKDLISVLADHKLLYESILKSNKSQIEVVEKLFINTPDLQFNGELKAIPLKIFRNKVIAILIEIRNYTQPIIDDRLKIWGKSIQKIAHDIKTPLSTIALNLKSIQLNLEKSGINNDDILKDIDAAKNEIDRIKNLTKDFLKFVDLEKPSFQVISVNEIILQSINRFDALTNEELKLDYSSNDLNKNVWADPRQLELVIHILVENAIDAIKGKGLIHLEYNLVQNLESKNEDMVQISITDNGSGIKKEIIEKIFEPHFSTKNDGTGMGLAFAKKIIQDHKGDIELHSREGFGTTFSFTLPIYNKN